MKIFGVVEGKKEKNLEIRFNEMKKGWIEHAYERFGAQFRIKLYIR